MKITMLGTGNAQVTECYNTCFVLEEEGALPACGRRRRKHSSAAA